MCKFSLFSCFVPPTDSNDHVTTLASTMFSDWSTVKLEDGRGGVESEGRENLEEETENLGDRGR